MKPEQHNELCDQCAAISRSCGNDDTGKLARAMLAMLAEISWLRSLHDAAYSARHRPTAMESQKIQHEEALDGGN